MPNEYTTITDIPKYLEQTQFGIEQWLHRKMPADAVLSKFMQFTQVLGLSDPDVRREYRIKSVDILETSPTGIIDSIIQKNTLFTPDELPSEHILLDSHLFLPYIFPHVLRVLSLTGLLSENGLKCLSLQALINEHADITHQQQRKIINNIPAGIFDSQQEALSFINYLVDTLREAYGKTQSTSDLLVTGGIQPTRNMFITRNPLRQKEVLYDLIQWYRPRDIPSLDYARYVVSRDERKESAEEYIKLQKHYEHFDTLIRQGLTRN